MQHKIKSIRSTILDKKNNVLNIYFTAGFPTLDSTEKIILKLAQAGVDLIELGMPYSDPLADGPTIQHSSAVSLQNGQTIHHVFQVVKKVRNDCPTPIILMVYLNQMLQYGVKRFLNHAQEAGIQGLIVPDLPMDVYDHEYSSLFAQHQMEISFLITPMTSDVRIAQADRLSTAFVYIVSQSSITGKQGPFDEKQIAYFERIKNLKLQSPSLIGFGIHDQMTRKIANQYSNGAIVGSAFIRTLETSSDLEANIDVFMSVWKD